MREICKYILIREILLFFLIKVCAITQYNMEALAMYKQNTVIAIKLLKVLLHSSYRTTI